MELALRFLLFLRKLAYFLRHRWGQSTRLLWYIFAFVRSRIFPKDPRETDKLRRDVEYRPAKPPTKVICASRFPPTLTPIAGGDTPITSPIPASIQVRQPRTSSHEDAACETHENHSQERSNVDPMGGGLIVGSPDSTGYRREPEPIHAILPPHREDSASPIIPFRPPSQYSYRSTSQYSVHRSPSQYSRRPPSQHPYHSPPNLNGAEAAAREYFDGSQSPRCSSPVPSVYPPSVAAAGASQVYHASRPISQVRRLQQMRNPPRRRVEFPTVAPNHHGIHDPPPELPRPESRTSGSIHRHRPDAKVTDPGHVLQAPSKGKLRPMVGIDRYEKQKAIVIEAVVNLHIASPVTTQFTR